MRGVWHFTEIIPNRTKDFARACEPFGDAAFIGDILTDISGS